MKAFMKERNLSFAILVLIIILGSFLRFYKLQKESLWNDELASWEKSNQDSLNKVLSLSRSDVHPPGYQILLYFAIKFLGDSEFWLRFPSAIAGIISILFIYLIGKKIYSEWEGLISAGLMAILWFPIYYSQEARVYSLLLLFSILSFYFWIIILERAKDGKIDFINSFFFVLSASIISYLHYFGLLFIILQGTGTFLIFFKRKKLLFFLLLYAVILILYLPWLPVMLEHSRREQIWIKKEWVLPTLLYLYHFFNRSKILFLSVLILYFYIPLQNFLKSFRERRKIKIETSIYTIVLIVWLISPFLLTFTKSLISTPVITVRNLIISLPPAYLLLSRAVTQLKLVKFIKVFMTLFIFGFSIFHLFFVISYYSKPHKEQYREAVYFVADNYKLFDNPLIIGYAWSKEHLNYYFKRKGFEKGVEYILGGREDIQSFEKIIMERKSEYIWFIRAHRAPDPEFINYIQKHFDTLIHISFIECDVLLLKIPESSFGFK